MEHTSVSRDILYIYAQTLPSMKIPIAILLLSLTLFSCDSDPENVSEDSFIPLEFHWDILISDSADIDWLNDFYTSGYNSIIGNLSIENKKNLDLSKLSNIEIVVGRVNVGKGQQSLDFLSKLRRIGSLSLHIDSVATLEPLTSLEFVEYDFIISDVASLKENAVFSKLDTIGGSFHCQFFRSVEYSIVFPQILEIKTIRFWHNDLDSFDLYPELKTANRISITDSKIKSIDGLRNLSEVGSILLNGNMELKNLHGLENLTNINELLSIAYNENLVDYCSIPLSAISEMEEHNWSVKSNAYNPSFAEFIQGKCKQAN